jgi:glycine betaine/choline ABC-type transport system substrate-binding protein
MKYLQLVKVAAKCKTITGKILKKGDEALRFSSDRTTGEIYIVTREEINDALSKQSVDMAPKFTNEQLKAMQKKAQETKKNRETMRKLFNGIKSELSKHNISCYDPVFSRNFYESWLMKSFIHKDNYPTGWIQIYTDKIVAHNNKGATLQEVELNDPNSIDTLINYLTR